MITSGLMSSDRQDWATPWDLFNKLDEEFKFDLDVCADHNNHKCDRYFTLEDNGLEQKWEGVVFCNPPYSSEAKDWIKKAYEYSLGGGDSSVSDSIKNGQSLVARIRDEINGNSFYQRSGKVHRCGIRRAIPIGGRSVLTDTLSPDQRNGIVMLV